MEIQFLVLLAFCSICDWFCADALSFFFSAACLVFTSCTSCIASQINFNCSWCHRLNRWENKPLFIRLSFPYSELKTWFSDPLPWGGAMNKGSNFTSSVSSYWNTSTLNTDIHKMWRKCTTSNSAVTMLQDCLCI